MLSMLASEAERRSPTIISGIEGLAASGKKAPDEIEKLRVEAHGLKGAANRNDPLVAPANTYDTVTADEIPRVALAQSSTVLTLPETSQSNIGEKR